MGALPCTVLYCTLLYSSTVQMQAVFVLSLNCNHPCSLLHGNTRLSALWVLQASAPLIPVDGNCAKDADVQRTRPVTNHSPASTTTTTTTTTHVSWSHGCSRFCGRLRPSVVKICARSVCAFHTHINTVTLTQTAGHENKQWWDAYVVYPQKSQI